MMGGLKRGRVGMDLARGRRRENREMWVGQKVSEMAGLSNEEEAGATQNVIPVPVPARLLSVCLFACLLTEGTSCCCTENKLQP